MTVPSILIFADWYNPGYKAGGPITSIVNLVGLLKNDFEIYIYTSALDLGETTPYDLPKNQWINGENGEKIFYAYQQKLTRSLFNTIVETASPKYVYFNSLFSVNYFIKPLIFSPKNQLKYLSPRGMLHPKALGQKSFKKQLFLFLLRRLPTFKKVHLIATDDTEKQHIIANGFKNKITIASNIPDLSFFDLELNNQNTQTVITVSRIAEEKNSIAAINAVGQLKTPVTYLWAGEAVDEAYLRQFNIAVSNLPPNVTFKQIGAVNRKGLKNHLQQAAIFFLPTHGENFGHSIFEALAAGKPAVIGANTPFHEIAAHNAGFAIASDNLAEMTRQLNHLLSLDHKAYIKACTAARLFAQKCVSLDLLKAQYKAIWDESL